MMSKTHITVGIAASLAIMNPSTVGELLPAIIGGSVGGILCDIECKSRKGMRDALTGRMIAFSIVLIALCLGFLTGYGIFTGTAGLIQDKGWFRFCFGAFDFLAACILGRLSRHRTFTHSFLFIALIALGLHCAVPSLCFPTVIGMLSHLILDSLNKKPVPWLYPFFQPGFCLGLCRAQGLLNRILMWSGLVASILLVGMRMQLLSASLAA